MTVQRDDWTSHGQVTNIVDILHINNLYNFTGRDVPVNLTQPGLTVPEPGSGKST